MMVVGKWRMSDCDVEVIGPSQQSLVDLVQNAVRLACSKHEKWMMGVWWWL
jgi:hypothetical protein